MILYFQRQNDSTLLRETFVYINIDIQFKRCKYVSFTYPVAEFQCLRQNNSLAKYYYATIRLQG